MLRRRSTNEELGTITISAGLAQLREDETRPTCSNGRMRRFTPPSGPAAIA